MTKQNNFLMLTTACIASLLVANADIHCSNHTKSSYDEDNHSISQIPSDHQTQLTGVNGTKREEKVAGGSEPKNLYDQIQQICKKQQLNDEDELSLEKLKQQYNGNINTLCKIIHIIKQCAPELQLKILANIDLTSLAYDCIDNVYGLIMCITNLVGLAPDAYNYIMHSIGGTSDERFKTQHYALPHILRDFDKLSSFIENMRGIFIVEAQQKAIDTLAFVYAPQNLITTIQELEQIIGHISHIYPPLQRRFIDNLKLADVVSSCIGSGVNNLSSVLSAINTLGYNLTTKKMTYINGKKIIEYGLKEGQSRLDCGVKIDLQSIQTLGHKVYVKNLDDFDYNSSEVYKTLHNFDTNLKKEFIEKLNLADLADRCIAQEYHIVDTLKVIGAFEKRLQPLLIDKLDLAQITTKHINDFFKLSDFLNQLNKLDGELLLTAIEKLKLADLTACCIECRCNDNDSDTYKTRRQGISRMLGIRSVIEWVATLGQSLQLKAIKLLDLADITAKYIGDVFGLQRTIESIGQCDTTLRHKIFNRLNIIELGCKYIYEKRHKQIFINSVGDTIPDALEQTTNIINFSDAFVRNPEYLKKFLLNTQNHDNQRLLKDIQKLKRTYIVEKYININKSIELFFRCMQDVKADTQQLIIDELNIAATVSKYINSNARSTIDFVNGLKYLHAAQQLKLLENPQINNNITFSKKFLLDIIALTIPLCTEARQKILRLPNIEIKIGLDRVRNNRLRHGWTACAEKDYAIVLLQRKMYELATPEILVSFMKDSPMNMVGRVMRYWTCENHRDKAANGTDKEETQKTLNQWYSTKSTETTQMHKILSKIQWIYKMDKNYILNDLSPDNIREIFTAIGSIQSEDTRNEYYRAIVGYLTNEHDKHFRTPGFRNFMLQWMHDNGVTLRNLLDMIDEKDIDKKIEKLDLSHCMSWQNFYGITALAEVYCAPDAQNILDEYNTKEGTEFKNLDDVILDDVINDESITQELLKILTEKYNEEIGG